MRKSRTSDGEAAAIGGGALHKVCIYVASSCQCLLQVLLLLFLNGARVFETLGLLGLVFSSHFSGGWICRFYGLTEGARVIYSLMTNHMSGRFTDLGQQLPDLCIQTAAPADTG